MKNTKTISGYNNDTITFDLEDVRNESIDWNLIAETAGLTPSCKRKLGEVLSNLNFRACNFRARANVTFARIVTRDWSDTTHFEIGIRVGFKKTHEPAFNIRVHKFAITKRGGLIICIDEKELRGKKAFKALEDEYSWMSLHENQTEQEREELKWGDDGKALAEFVALHEQALSENRDLCTDEQVEQAIENWGGLDRINDFHHCTPESWDLNDCTILKTGEPTAKFIRCVRDWIRTHRSDVLGDLCNLCDTPSFKLNKDHECPTCAANPIDTRGDMDAVCSREQAEINQQAAELAEEQHAASSELVEVGTEKFVAPEDLLEMDIVIKSTDEVPAVVRDEHGNCWQYTGRFVRRDLLIKAVTPMGPNEQKARKGVKTFVVTWWSTKEETTTESIDAPDMLVALQKLNVALSRVLSCEVALTPLG